MNIVAAQLGARMYYAVPRILEQNDMLGRFHTDMLGDRGWARLLQAVPAAWRPGAVRRLLGRTLRGVPPHKVQAHGDITLRIQWQLRRARNSEEIARIFIWAGDELARRVLDAGLSDADAVFVVGSSSRLLFEEARRRGVRTIKESIIAAPAVEHRLLAAEAKKFPEWAVDTMNVNAADFVDLVRHEWGLSDLIVCGSEFVRESIAEDGGPVDRCVVVPYGLDQQVATAPRQLAAGRPFRVLTVGALGLRKGTPYVLQAAGMLKETCEFKLAGGWQVRESVLRAAAGPAVLVGVVPRNQIKEHYAWADAFLLPSICEGSATVIYEALAAGLPIITTRNSGSVVVDGREGFIVPIGDTGAMATALETLRSDARGYAAMSAAALAAARLYSFERYSTSLGEAIRRSAK